MPRVFLTAEWRNLILVSYHAPAGLLDRYLPNGLDLDLIDGAPALSLVAFEFRSTRVFGVPWPGFVNFPEWNLRFYAKTREPTPRRGVVFVREFVPSRFVSRVARQIYNEPYAAAPLRHHAQIDAGGASARYEVRFNGKTHSLGLSASATLSIPETSTIAHALKEHQWGFGQTRTGQTLCYEVNHPTWRIRAQPHAVPIVDADWAKLYGAEWSIMQNATPFSALLVEGSAITVSTATLVH